MPCIHLVIGPVGAGKSTYVRGLCAEHGALALNLDEWMARLFGPDRPGEGVMAWYVERTERCVDQIWSVTEGALAAGVDVVLEIGLIRRRDRESLYARVDAGAHDLAIHVLDAPREVRRARVQRRNAEQGATYVMHVPDEIFELASDMWEPPTPDEVEDRDVRFVPAR
jgi:predicted kinase